MQRLVKLLASMRLTVVLLLILSVLVVWGTLYQAEHGLYQAQKIFYQSYGFLAFGMIPMPGTQSVLALLFINLLCAMLLTIRYRWRRLGSILTHGGLLVLLGGGFVIGRYAEESNLTLEEGEGSNVSMSYHEWEIAAWAPEDMAIADEAHRRTRRVAAVPTAALRPGDTVRLGDTGLTLDVETYYRNAAPGGQISSVIRAPGGCSPERPLTPTPDSP